MEVRRVVQAQMPLQRPFRVVDESNVAMTARSSGVPKSSATEVADGSPVVPLVQQARRRASRRDAERFEIEYSSSRGWAIDERR
jgi:hypothetical protein